MKKTVIISALIIILLTFTVLPGIGGLTGPDALAASTTLDLGGPGLTTITQIQTAMSTAISAASSGDTITVTGSFTGTTTQLAMPDIPSGVTIIWRAEYIGNVTGSGWANSLIRISGQGTLEISAGAWIENEGNGHTIYSNEPTSSIHINLTHGGTPAFGPVVEADTGSAIHMEGAGDRVTVDCGQGGVFNAATTNLHPAINMVHSSPTASPNVLVQSGEVTAIPAGNDSEKGYAIQTTGNITVTGGAVTAREGRAINLVGTNSTATINGGRITTETATAISTATTNPGQVPNAKVIVNGGIVEAIGTGKAIAITGASSTVDVNGGKVLARSGLAIDASGSPAAPAITVSGGFVFAWGSAVTGSTNVIQPAAKLNASVGGVIAAWNTSTGVGAVDYIEGEFNHLSWLPAGASVFWHKHSTGDGISYSNGGTPEFHGLDVRVIKPTIYYLLTINSGYSPPQYRLVEAGETVTITADPEIAPNPEIDPSYNPVNGTAFNTWISSGGGTLASPGSASTTFTMPEGDATVTATYSPRYLLHTRGGTIDAAFRNIGRDNYGYFAEGQQVGVTATDLAPANVFKNWAISPYATTGGYFGAAPGSSTTTSTSAVFTMPPGSAMIFTETDPPIDIPPKPAPQQRTVSVISGSGTISGFSETWTGAAGTVLSLSARTPGADETFLHWQIVSGSGHFDNLYEANTNFIAFENAVLEAVFDDRPHYTLTVINLSATDVSARSAGESITIIAEPPVQGMKFDHWEFVAGGSSLRSHLSEHATFPMPPEDVVLKAMYSPAGAPRDLDSVPKTGEEENYAWPAVVLMVLAAGGAVFVIMRLRRKA